MLAKFGVAYTQAEVEQVAQSLSGALWVVKAALKRAGDYSPFSSRFFNCASWRWWRASSASAIVSLLLPSDRFRHGARFKCNLRDLRGWAFMVGSFGGIEGDFVYLQRVHCHAQPIE